LITLNTILFSNFEALMKVEKIWYSFQGGSYQGTAPAFYPTSDFEDIVALEKASEEIFEELKNYLHQHAQGFDPYFNTQIVSKPLSWKMRMIQYWGVENKDVTKKIPLLWEKLSKIKGITSASISYLSPQTSIDTHIGDTSAIIRCHLGIDVPAGLPTCGIEVKNEQKAWENGKVLMFCDAHPHRAWNLSEHGRSVLIFDILRPEYRHLKKKICADAHSILSLQKLGEKYKWVEKLPGFIRGILRHWFKNKLLLSNKLTNK